MGGMLVFVAIFIFLSIPKLNQSSNRRIRSAPTTIAATTPSAAASVAVASPKYIVPRTANTRKANGQIRSRPARRRGHGTAQSPGGVSRGWRRAIR